MNQSAEPVSLSGGEAEVPVCLQCLEPVHPLDKVCPQCGAAVGQLTPYLPYESIRWSAGVYGQMWAQIWRKDVPLVGRVFRMFLVIFGVPVLLVGLIPRAWRKLRGEGRNTSSGT